MNLISIQMGKENQVIIKTRSHRVISDLSIDDGGGDKGLSPSEMMVAAIGSCMALMVDQYCRKQGYLDGSVEVNSTYEMTDQPNRISAITIDLELPRDVPEEKKKIIKKLAIECPVHQTLLGPLDIDIDII
jgi:putative redox protein